MIRRTCILALLSTFSTGCALAPKYRVSTELPELGMRGSAGEIPVQAPLPDLADVEILGKVWVFKWARSSFGSVSDEELFDLLSVPASALGAEQIVGAHASSVCTYEGAVTGLGNDIGESGGMSKWASGLAVRAARSGDPSGPSSLIVAVPAFLGVVPGSEPDVALRKGLQSILEQRGYYTKMVDLQPFKLGRDPSLRKEFLGVSGRFGSKRYGHVFRGRLSGQGRFVLFEGALVSTVDGSVTWSDEHLSRYASKRDTDGVATLEMSGGGGLTGGDEADNVYEAVCELLTSLPSVARQL